MIRQLPAILVCAALLGPAPHAVMAAGLAGRFASQQPLEKPEYLPERQGDQDFDLPDVPEGTVRPGLAGRKFLLKGVELEGNSVYSEVELAEIFGPYLAQPVSLADLEEIRLAITRKYTENGYVNSGALLPDQHITDGVIRYRIVEGRLNEINISGQQRLRPQYISDRLRLDVPEDQPLNIQRLQRRFQLLLTDPLIERLNGALKPGVRPGESVLDLEVTRAQPYRLNLAVDNYNPPSTGALKLDLDGTLWNLTGFGDDLRIKAEASDGGWDLLGRFSLPLTASGLRAFVSYERTETSVVEESLALADIESKFEDLNFGLSYPWLNDQEIGLVLEAVLTRRKSQTFMLGQPTPFSAGVDEDGTARTTVIRLGQDFTWRQASQVFAARSTFNFGVDALGSSVNARLPDSRFLTWLGQVQYARRMRQSDQLVLRGNLQLSNDELLPMERFSVGGRWTVRGYRENELVRDMGFSASLEYYLTLSGSSEGNQSSLQLVPFVDVGGAWNKGDYDNRDVIAGAGVGLLWRHKPFNAELFYAYGLTDEYQHPDYDLQDDGLHFRFSVDVF